MSWTMHRRLVLVGLAAALFASCQNSPPVGPGKVTVTQTTSSTTTSSTTTSTVTPATRASFTVSPNPASVGQQVLVNASGSTALPGRSLTSFNWDFGDATLKAGMTSQHDYGAPGTFMITLTVTDNTGQQATTSQPVTIGGTATTTSTPVTSSAVHFVAAAPPSNPAVPADMTLFFQLVTGNALTTFASRLGLVRPLANSTYTVTGVYSTNNNAGTGQVKNGTFTGTLTPSVDGTFTGTLAANVQGCTAERPFSGPLVQFLSWTASGPATGTCSPNPMSTVDAVALVKTDAPPTTSSTTTSSTTTTSTTSTTTTTSTCTYQLSSLSAEISSSGGSGTVDVITNAGCGWTAQSLVPFVTVKDLSGTGTATVNYTVASNSGSQRTGGITVAGIRFDIAQFGGD